MENRRLENEWNDLKETWTKSSQTRDIHIRVSDLLSELKSKASQFEKKAIKNDVAMLKANWAEAEGMISQFEKNAIRKDLALVTRLFNKLLNLFNKNS